MKTMLYRTAAVAALVMPSLAFAQSTGSVDFEEGAIVVTGTRAQDVAGIQSPDTTKAKQVLTQELIERQNPGQSILDTVNVVPGVNFQNNDAYGSSGGKLSIRGFTSDRISLTVDGIPLNDSGGYAIYSNQQFDPEIIDQVNVNLGSTDVDSPTAAASGSTVNYRTITPSEEMGGTLSVSYGDFDFFRVFGKIETGEFTPFGTRAFFTASKATNDNPFNNYGRVDKQQYNAKIYQPIGDNGDFVSVAGHYNENRNNFFGSVRLRTDNLDLAVPNRFPVKRSEREYDINFPCSVDTPQAGVIDSTNTCGTEFDRRYNPSNTGNIRLASRFTLSDSITLSVDPSYQYVKANGGGTVTGREGTYAIDGTQYTGFIGGQYYFGRDLNGDGDILDTCSTVGAACSSRNFNGVTLMAPSQTRTDRYGVIANLTWDLSDEHRFRIAYTLDHARHRQTGQVGALYANGEPMDVFPANDPMTDVDGHVINKRDRLSYAILNQIAGEYRGKFLEEALTVNLGLRAPFFKRKLNNYCFTTSVTGNTDCFSTNDEAAAAYAEANPTVQGPQKRVFKYDKMLPNIGLTYEFSPRISAFANYSKGVQVPGTDNLYNAFYFASDEDAAKPKPETTDNFDLGLRYRSGKVQAQLSGWYTKYTNRLASAYDPETERNIYRNLGTVDKYGVDGYVSYAPVDQFAVYLFGSLLKSEIKDNVLGGACTAAQVTANVTGCAAVGDDFYYQTAGQRESGAAKYSYGGTVRGNLGPVELGVTAKRTGPRYLFDTNQPLVIDGVQQYGAKAPAYWLVNADARFSMADFGLEKTYFQLNVYNLFNKLYVGGLDGGLTQGTSAPFVQIGAPRTVSGTLVVGF